MKGKWPSGNKCGGENGLNQRKCNLNSMARNNIISKAASMAKACYLAKKRSNLEK
jgi:hypothetical protein